MSKLTQKDILTEGFLDNIRQAAGRLTKPLAKVTAGALGGIGKAALQVGKDIATGNTSATLSNVARQGVSGAVSAYKSERDKQINVSPERFLENELITNWSAVFDPASIKITKQEEAAPMAHKSFKLSKVNRFFVSFEANKYNKSGGITRAKNIATIVRGSDGKFKLEDIKDETGYTINSGIDAGKRIKNYDSEISPFIRSIPNSTNPLLSDYAKVIRSAFKLTAAQIKEIADDQSITTNSELLSRITNKNLNDTLDQNDINAIKKAFKDNLIAENSQINLLKQLKLLNDSYNKTYELSKH